MQDQVETLCPGRQLLCDLICLFSDYPGIMRLGPSSSLLLRVSGSQTLGGGEFITAVAALILLGKIHQKANFWSAQVWFVAHHFIQQGAPFARLFTPKKTIIENRPILEVKL